MSTRIRFSVGLTAILLAVCFSTSAFGWTKKRHLSNAEESAIMIEQRMTTFTLTQASNTKDVRKKTNDSDVGYTASYFAYELGLSYVSSQSTGVIWKIGIYGSPKMVSAVPFEQRLHYNNKVETFALDTTGATFNLHGGIGYAFWDVYFLTGLGTHAVWTFQEGVKNFHSESYIPDMHSFWAGVTLPVQVGWNIPIHKYVFMQVYAEIEVPLKGIRSQTIVKAAGLEKLISNENQLQDMMHFGINVGVPF